MYVKDLMKITGERYQKVIADINMVNSKFKPAGGPNASIDMNSAKKVCQRYGISFVENENGSLQLFRNLDNQQITYVPQIPAREEQKENPNQKALDKFNSFEAEEVDPLKVRARMNQIDTNVISAIKFINSKNLIKKKTILKDSMMHDMQYLNTLFSEYSYLISPVNISKKMRLKLQPLFLHTYVCGDFNNKLIGFNDREVLHAYIINV